MTIKNRLRILALVPIIMLIVIVSGGLLGRQQLVGSFRARELVDDVTLGVFNLNLLSTDYVQSSLERAEVQWQVRYQSVGDTLSRVQVTSVEGQLVLDRLRASYEEVGALFSSLVVATREPGLHHEEIAEALASQLFIESQTMVTDCSILANIAEKELLNAQQQAAYVFWPTLILAVLGGLAGSLLIYRSIAKPVRELMEGTEVVGNGNLDYKVGTSAKDEIGALSRAFDQMTANLKAITVSRDELANEIAQRKQAEESLRESERGKNSILNAISDIVAFQSGSLSYLWVNEAAAQSLGKRPEELVGQRCYELWHGRSQPCENCPVLKALETGSREHGIMTTLDGRHWEIIGEPVLNSAGEVVGAIEVARDITGRKQDEEQLKVYSEQLEEMVEERTKQLRGAQEDLVRAERLATLGQFSGSVSHELRNPLGVIDSSVYYLKAQLKEADEKVHQHLDRIKSSVASSTAIIQSLLDLTRMKEPQLARLDLVRVISDGIATSGVPGTVEVIEDFAGQEIAVNGDGEQLRMALKNIVKNAAEAMGDQGTLTVTVRSTADGQAEVSFADTGIGIPAENLEKVFQPLFSTKARGIGFGLSIARMIVDRHRGMVEANSEPGKGATIVIRLPLAENAKVEM